MAWVLKTLILWEIHEAFAAWVLANVAAIERNEWIQSKTGVYANFGTFPLRSGQSE